MIIIPIILIVIAAIAYAVFRNKLSNRIHKDIMKSTGLGNKLNENFDQMNAKALTKLDQMLEEGKITQEQYDRRKKNLMKDFDFNN